MSPASASGNNAAYSQVALAAPAVDVVPRGNGEFLLDSTAVAGDMPRQVNDYLNGEVVRLDGAIRMPPK